MAGWAPPIHLVTIAAAAAPPSIGSDLTVVSITIRPGFKLDDIPAIWVDVHSGGPIVEVTRLRTDIEPGDVIEILVLLCDINGAANDDEKAT